MEIPHSLLDHSLLKAEPFSSFFYAHRFNESKSRRSKQGEINGFYKRVVSDVQKNAKALNAARKWLEIAFAPHPEEYERSRIQSIQPDDPDSLLIFVRFYHHLDLDDVIAATKYLRSERKKRGHNFDGPGVRNDDENNASSIHVGNGRPKKTKRSKGGATELPSGGVLSLPPPETPRSEETSLEVPSHLENVEVTRLEISSQYPSHSKPDGSTPQAPEMDDGEEIQTLQSENKRKKKIRSTPHLVVDTSHQCIPHPPPNHVPQSPTSSPLTDLSESTPSPSFTPDLVPKSRMRSGKKSRPLHPPSRTLPSRAASNPDRLSEIIRSENKHYSRLRSGRDPTPETNAGGLTSPVGRVVSSSKNRSSRKRRKKASVRKGDVSDNMDRGVPEHTISHIESATQDDEPANQEMASQGAAAPGPSFPPEPKHQCDARKNASKKKRQRRQKNFSPDGRICLPPPSNKRQRKNDSSFSAVDTSTGQELAQQPNSPLVVPVDSTGELVASQLQKDPEVCITSSRILGSQDMKANQLLSNSVQPMRSSSSRKRSRDETEVYVVESLVHQGPMGEEIPRGSKPLPKRNHHSTMPLPPRPDLGTVHPGDPMRLVDVDRYICDIAAAESVLLTDTGVRHDDWVEAISDSTINSREGDDEGGVGKAPMITDGPLSTLASTEGDTGYSSNPAVITSSRPQMPIISSPEQVHLPKRALAQFPPIWAQSRQEVCESFDWFRSYQGGVYFAKDIVKGYLLGGFSSGRDIFQHRGKLIVSHGGGKAESLHKNHGQIETHQASDQQADDKSVRALLKTYEMKRPLVLLVDDKYALFPFDLAEKGCTYAILGFYRIAYAWAEKQPSPEGCVVRFKFAFQWCEEQGQPWWIQMHSALTELPLTPEAEGTPPNVSSDDVPDLGASHSQSVFKECDLCRRSSPKVYAERWVCLNSSCANFWLLEEGDTPPDSLSYSTSFLALVPFAPQELVDIRPSPPPNILSQRIDVTTSRHFCKGWHCRSCGRLSSRFKWEHWECKNCGATYGVSGRLRSAKEFVHQVQGSTFHRHHHSKNAGVQMCGTRLFRYGKGFSQYVTFIFPHTRGKVHLIMAAPLANGEADAILQKYQTQAKSGELKFRRWPLRAHKCRGTLLSNYFSQNTGEPYQYVGGADNTVPFEPGSAVTDALNLIKKRTEQALGHERDFNEVLSAAYMEKQKMAYHSDAERGLGPVVASLSLGASAYMHFRLHSQYAEEAGEGCSREVLSLFLRHGDVVVMEGDGVQKYYEHTVVPLNFRVAATARFIDNSKHY